ncbi:LAQU0S24e00232g1_1 [Lachancea quebecensis]|uniref:LAQU0S24e00232g1_1 n=1 Tax=Lachancea quebecensis TaxID=1654605 RepID=A0A0P1L9N2_9SACH|nr:LAQU0S24e00232g1_1 [Lachancea quebecensis]
MLLERFHNKLHGSRLSRHSNSKSRSKCDVNAQPAQDLTEDLMTGDGVSDSDAYASMRELQINTQFCEPRGGTPLNGVSTPVMTPVMQPIMPYMYGNQKRQDSVVSFASSISDMPGPARTATTPLPTTFSTQFVKMLMEVYQDICSDPTATPFDAANPPSGILNRTAKVAVERAEQKGVDLGREKNALLVNSVKQRLLQELRRDAYLSRNSSIVSLPPMPQFNASDIAPTACADYFSSHTETSCQGQLSTPFQMPTSSSGNNQALQTPFDQRSQVPKLTHRSRNDSFISAAGRSRSGSSHMLPFQQQQQQLQPSVALQPSSFIETTLAPRAQYEGNGYFVLTPTNSLLGDSQQPSIVRERSNASSAFEDVMSSELTRHRQNSFRIEKGSAAGSLAMDF